MLIVASTTTDEPSDEMKRVVIHYMEPADYGTFSLSKNGKVTLTTGIIEEGSWLDRLLQKVSQFFMAKKQKKTAKKPTTTKTRTLRSFDPVGDCYVCEKSLRMRDLDIISELTSDEGTQFINFINCSHCGGAYGTYLVIEPGGMARGEFYENDAVGIEEFKRFLNGAEVSADDVIDTYLALESGEVDSFIKAANKNKPKMKKAKYG